MAHTEAVVLLDDDGNDAGSARKSEVHQGTTPLHLGFSCYLIDDEGRLLVTRRALSKLTWPGVWTNSFCGHPEPGEAVEHAVRRRALQELGTALSNVACVLPEFRYRAVDAGGIEENEVCPVFVAMLDGPLDPIASEVAEWAWVNPHHLAQALERAPFAFSPWMVEQMPQLLSLRAFGGSP